MTDDKDKRTGEHTEKRREKRYPVSREQQKLIKLHVKTDTEFIPATLGNFSRNGILFESAAPFREGELAECSMSISFMPSREITFTIEVRYCSADHGSHIIGASIDAISDDEWFDVFANAFDSIVLRREPTDDESS